MNAEHSDLDRMQREYKAAVDDWVRAIRHEETLASGNHTVAQVDRWELAHLEEEAHRRKAKAAKRAYEDALRRKFFGF